MSDTADATNCYFNSVWTNTLLKINSAWPSHYSGPVTFKKNTVPLNNRNLLIPQVFKHPPYSLIFSFLMFCKQGQFQLQFRRLPRSVSTALNLTSRNWEEQGQRQLYIPKIKTKFTIYWQQCFYLYLQKKTRWYQKDNLPTKNSNIALSILCLNTTDLWISQFKSSLIQQECVQRPAGVWNKMLIPHKASNSSIVQRNPNSKLLQEVGGEETPSSDYLTPPQTFYRLKTMQTTLEANALSTRALQLVHGAEQRAPGGTGAAHATVHSAVWLTLWTSADLNGNKALQDLALMFTHAQVTPKSESYNGL